MQAGNYSIPQSHGDNEFPWRDLHMIDARVILAIRSHGLSLLWRMIWTYSEDAGQIRQLGRTHRQDCRGMN